MIPSVRTTVAMQQKFPSRALFNNSNYRKASGFVAKHFPRQVENINSGEGPQIGHSLPPGSWRGSQIPPGSRIRPSLRLGPSLRPGSWIGSSLPPYTSVPGRSSKARQKWFQILHSRRSKISGNHRSPYVDYLYARLLPFKCKDPTYTLIKVGASVNPGKRLYDLGRALNRLVDCGNQDFRPTRMRVSRLPTAVIDAARTDPNILLLVGIRMKPFKHKSMNPDRLNAELKVRQTLGWATGRHFTEKFKQCVREQDRNKMKHAELEALTGGSNPDETQLEPRTASIEKALGDCGLSEWVLCRTKTVETVQKAFRAGRLDSSCRNNTWETWQPFVGRLRSVLQHVAAPADLIKVKLEFTISGKKFSVTVEAYCPV